jgi:hypothetical protein
MQRNDLRLFFDYWPWTYIFPACVVLGLVGYLLFRKKQRLRVLASLSLALGIAGLIVSLYIVTFAKNHLGAKEARDRWMERSQK